MYSKDPGSTDRSAAGCVLYGVVSVCFVDLVVLEVVWGTGMPYSLLMMVLVVLFVRVVDLVVLEVLEKAAVLYLVLMTMSAVLFEAAAGADTMGCADSCATYCGGLAPLS